MVRAAFAHNSVGGEKEMSEKKRKPKEEVVPLFITLPVSFAGERAEESNIGVQTEDDVNRMKAWVDFNEK